MRSASTAPQREQRQSPRVVPLSSRPVEVQIMGRAFLEVLTAEDVSVGGVGVRVPHGLDIGDQDEPVELIVSLPGAKPFKARAVIRHRQDAALHERFGVEFTHLPESAPIHEYVQQMLALGRRA